jgi:hypothetical protein
MSSLNDFVTVNISRETTAVSVVSFGVLAIVAEFAANKPTTPFTGRTRSYASIIDMASDGWSSSDDVYKAALAGFSQNPSITSILVGRKHIATDVGGEETWDVCLSAMQLEETDWYGVVIIPNNIATITFAGNFVTGNSIVPTINGTALTAVPYNTNQQTTMADLKTVIEAGITGAHVTISSSPYRIMTLSIDSSQVASVSFAITGGASQTTYTVTYSTDSEYLEAAAWIETQMKVLGVLTSDPATLTAATTDISYQLKTYGYNRTFSIYHSTGMNTGNYLNSAWFGKMLPTTPGSANWAFKTLAGVSTYNITPSQRGFALEKNCNIYTSTAGVSITEMGNVASGEWIDIIIGVDWIQANLQSTVFSTLVNAPKIPYTDEGIQIIVGKVDQVLNQAVINGIIASGYVITAPRVANISTNDKANRHLPDVKFTAILQGAINTVAINGTVTY